MSERGLAFECPFYYNGMTFEDKIYLQHHLAQQGGMFTKILNGEIKLPPRSERTKEDVFEALGADLDYVYDDSML